MPSDVVVRFAPSPTGYLHIGGARTAIFNWLYARRTGGKFILRIEDTDAHRSTDDAIEGIVEGMRWLGLDWDEGPHFQSRFVKEHLAAAHRLLASGNAYKCFCSPETLERKREQARRSKAPLMYDGACRRLSEQTVARLEAEGRPFTIRLKVPRTGGAVRFDDRVCGRIEKKYRDIEDFILVRSNGRPLYVLSNAVDDIRDRISHVIRGKDGLDNTPKQILIYQALQKPLPTFVHMSLALDPQKAKISKRKHGDAVSIQFYRKQGFIPWALVNFLVLLGWATADSRELFTPEELIAAFDLEGISSTNSVFDIRSGDPKYFTDPKAVSINAHYLRTLPLEELTPHIQENLQAAGLWRSDYAAGGPRHQWFLQVVDLIRERFHYLTDFATDGRAYFEDDFPINPQALEKNLLRHPALRTALPETGRRLSRLEAFDADAIERCLRDFAAESGLKVGVLANGLRTAVTGQAKGPGVVEVLTVLGPRSVLRRTERAAVYFTRGLPPKDGKTIA